MTNLTPKEEVILTLFKELTVDRQSAVLDELHEFLEDDGIAVEIIDEDGDVIGWTHDEIIDNEQPIGCIDD
jgi:hypothetical protein